MQNYTDHTECVYKVENCWENCLEIHCRIILTIRYAYIKCKFDGKYNKPTEFNRPHSTHIASKEMRSNSGVLGPYAYHSENHKTYGKSVLVIKSVLHFRLEIFFETFSTPITSELRSR